MANFLYNVLTTALGFTVAVFTLCVIFYAYFAIKCLFNDIED